MNSPSSKLLGWMDRLKVVFNSISAQSSNARFETRMDQAILSAQEHAKKAEQSYNAAKASVISAIGHAAEIDVKIAAAEKAAIAHLRSRRVAQAKEISRELVSLQSELKGWGVRELEANAEVEQSRVLRDYLASQERRLRAQLALSQASARLARGQAALDKFGSSSLHNKPSFGEGLHTRPPESADEILSRLRVLSKEPVKETVSPMSARKSTSSTKKTATPRARQSRKGNAS